VSHLVTSDDGTLHQSICLNSLNGFTLDILLPFVSFDIVKSTLGVVLVLVCTSSSFSGIGSSF
jgi:hypothetical protein